MYLQALNFKLKKNPVGFPTIFYPDFFLDYPDLVWSDNFENLDPESGPENFVLPDSSSDHPIYYIAS
jgi:hypothetical protein